MSTVSKSPDVVKTDIPARMDRLPWSRWHWLIIIALGITWILDGIEVTIVGDIGATLTKRSTLNLTTAQVSFAGSVYIIGAVVGALFFGYLTDRLGRKRLFMVTLGVYLLFTAATAFSWSLYSFYAFRFLTGLGIGGEYAAINSAIDELIPARVRGWVDLLINGSYWIGSIIGSVTTIFTLDPHIIPTAYGWRVSFAVGIIIAFCVLLVRHYVPESPRWLMIHGKLDRANAIVSGIEEKVMGYTGVEELPEPGAPITLRPRGSIGFIAIAKNVFGTYPKRTVLGLSLFIGQAFLYNAIFFTYGLVLTTFFKISASSVPYYLIAFAIGNFAGPALLGRLFDTIGRRKMISFTYIFSGVALGVSGYLFEQGMLNAYTQTIAWVVIFFFASAGASSAYLTVSEIFPLELRSMAIGFFYAVGTGVGGFTGPLIYGRLIATKNPVDLFYGYILGAALMVAAGIVEVFLGINAERRSLESIANPLSAGGKDDEVEEDERQAAAPGGAPGGAQGAQGAQGSMNGRNAAPYGRPATPQIYDGAPPATMDTRGRQQFIPGDGATYPVSATARTHHGRRPDGTPTTSIDVHIDLSGDEALQDIHLTLVPQAQAQAEALEHEPAPDSVGDQRSIRGESPQEMTS